MYTSYTYCNSGHAIIKIQENKHERDSREGQRSEKEKKTGHYQENSFNGCIRTGFAWPNKGEKSNTESTRTPFNPITTNTNLPALRNHGSAPYVAAVVVIIHPCHRVLRAVTSYIKKKSQVRGPSRVGNSFTLASREIYVHALLRTYMHNPTEQPSPSPPPGLIAVTVRST